MLLVQKCFKIHGDVVLSFRSLLQMFKIVGLILFKLNRVQLNLKQKELPNLRYVAFFSFPNLMSPTDTQKIALKFKEKSI